MAYGLFVESLTSQGLKNEVQFIVYTRKKCKRFWDMKCKFILNSLVFFFFLSIRGFPIRVLNGLVLVRAHGRPRNETVKEKEELNPNLKSELYMR